MDDLAESGSDRHAGHAEVGVIESIKEFGSELHPHAFGQREILGEIEIEIHYARAADDCHAGVAEDLVRGAGGNEYKNAGIKCGIFAVGRVLTSEKCCAASEGASPT